MKNIIRPYLGFYKNLNLTENTLLILITLIALSFFVFRDFGVLNVVSDERTYSTFARLVKMSDSILSNYVYLKIYSITNICGDNFYSCTKWLNELIYLLGCYLIYKISRLSINIKWAFYLLAIMIFFPINSYTSYFMPESLYFCFFWLLIYYLLAVLMHNIDIIRHYFVLGFLIAILSMIKPHALFIIPVILSFLYYINCHSEFKKSIIKKILIVIIVFITIRFLIGYILAGPNGLNLLGQIYAGINEKISYHHGDIFKSISDQAVNIFGHILPMLFIYFLPFIFIFQKIGNKEKNKLAPMAILFFGIYLTMLFISSYFTISISGYSVHEEINRIHSRYYNFIIPGIFILFLTAFSDDYQFKKNKKFNFYLIIIYLILFIFIINYRLWFNPNLVDSPEIASLVFNRIQIYFLGLLLFISLILYLYNHKIGLIFYSLIFFPAYIVGSMYFVNGEFQQRSKPDIYDSAGFFVRSLLPESEISKLLIISPAETGSYRSMFILSNADIGCLELPLGTSVDTAIRSIPGKEWVLLIGDYQEPTNSTFHMQANGSHLYHIAKEISLSFTQSSLPGVVESISGMYSSEPWGSWSEGKQVSIKFSFFLPSNFDLKLDVKAFGENNNIDIKIGSNQYVLKINSDFNQYIIPVRGLTSKVNNITFLIKNPTSPKQLGVNSDERMIGLAFKSLKIVPISKIDLIK